VEGVTVVHSDLADKSPAAIAGMFDAIAGRYDLLNGVLSGGIDRYWRWQAVRSLALTGRETTVDVCTGTADLVRALARPGRAARVVGVDFAGEMLKLGRVKLQRANPGVPAMLVRGDATRLPLGDNLANGLTIAFGIRNVQEPERACRECWRVLRPGGRLAILEFGTPQAPGLRDVYRWYFRYVLPRVGRLISHHDEAYTYLPASVSLWSRPERFGRLLESAGFTDVRIVTLTFGIVNLFTAIKR
jgi:demethylmenaquinone methyltransferase/2-methoxy-6-polyprenyl-1,4-benzoquinol methylase